MNPLQSVGDRLETVAGSAPARRAGRLLDEFRQFAFKGNVVDLAVGVIIGTAFGKIVDSMVKNVLMPVVGLVLPGDEGFKGWRWVVRGQEIPYGQFLAEVVNFLVVAAVLFLMVRKFLGLLVKEKETAPPPPTKEQELLTEIRDLLRQANAAAGK